MRIGIAFAVALMGSILGFALLFISIPIRNALHEGWLRFVHKVVLPLVVYAIALVHEIHQAFIEARKPKPAPAKRPKDGETIDVFVPAEAGPLVISPVSKNPLLLTQLPVQSTKAGAKKLALAYARQRTGNPALSWKAASKLMNQWGREERELERSMTPAYAEKMRELTEASA